MFASPGKSLVINDLGGPDPRKPLTISALELSSLITKKMLAVTMLSVILEPMKHSESGNRKVMKQLKKCPDIKEIRQVTHGYMILAKNGQQYLAHFSAKAFHPLRRWLKQNTSLKNLRF